MKKKNQEEDSENEFEIDEPEELQEHSDDEWAPVSFICATRELPFNSYDYILVITGRRC